MKITLNNGQRLSEIFTIKAEVEFTVNTATEAHANTLALELLDDGDRFDWVRIANITKFDPDLITAREYLASVLPSNAAAILQGDCDNTSSILMHFRAGMAAARA